jgi:PAS domain S-box-containing protein
MNYEQIFMQAPVGMCIAVDRVVQSCNLALAAMFGYARDELQGRSFSIMYPTMEEFVRTGDRVAPNMHATGTYSDAHIMRRKNGDLFWCHVIGKVPDHPRAAGAVVWTFEDISEKRPVSAALSPREREIAALLVAGKTSKMIARAIDLSPRTVEMYRAQLMKKYAAATSSELVRKLAWRPSSPGAG